MTDPARIQRIAAAVLGCVDDFIAQTDRARADGLDPGPWLVGNVTADEIRELAIAASQAVAPPEPVAEVTWVEHEGLIASRPSCYAKIGPLGISTRMQPDGPGIVWEVAASGGFSRAVVMTGLAPNTDAAKAAAIAAARAWRDSIRL